MAKRKFLEITREYRIKRREKPLVRVSHYDWRDLIKSGRYNETIDGKVYTLLTIPQFSNILGYLVNKDFCINLKGYHKDNLFPKQTHFFDIFRKSKRVGKTPLRSWGKDLSGKPQIMFLYRKIVFAINGELVVSPNFYNFRTNFAGVWLSAIHERAMRSVANRLECAYNMPKIKPLPFVTEAQNTIYYVKQETVTTTKG